MAEQETEHQQAQTTRRGPRLRRWAAGAMLALAAVLTLLWLSDRLTLQSVNKRLAAIEAARAIPDSENAATIYDRLMKDYGGSQVRWGVLTNLKPATNKTPDEPWVSDDNPQLAIWIKGHQALIADLLEPCTKELCRFAITGYPQNSSLRHERLRAMRSWAFLLLVAANNDTAEGRIKEGVEKYLAMIAMGVHLAQQPVIQDNIVGLAIESWALSRTCTYIVQGPFAQVHLEAIEAALPPIRNEWDNLSPQINEVDRLYQRKEHADWLAWIRHFWQDTGEPNMERLHELYLRELSSRRAMFILIALRRCKDKTGQWPSTLDEIRRLLPADALLDPLNGGAFVYRLTEDGFTLYSIGQNRIDENGEFAGRKKGRPDDYPYWPPWSRTFQQKKAAEKQPAKPDD
jgi:hypothetical protein